MGEEMGRSQKKPALAGRQRTNEEIVRAFAQCFDPPLMVVHTEHINNVKVRDGWAASGERVTADGIEVGFTAVAWGNGRFKAYCEIEGGSDTAAAAGAAMAKSLA